jgi:hypothetical protein
VDVLDEYIRISATPPEFNSVSSMYNIIYEKVCLKCNKFIRLFYLCETQKPIKLYFNIIPCKIAGSETFRIWIPFWKLVAISFPFPAQSDIFHGEIFSTNGRIKIKLTEQWNQARLWFHGDQFSIASYFEWQRAYCVICSQYKLFFTYSILWN